MSLSGMVRAVTSVDGLFDIVLVGIVVLAALVTLWAVLLTFGMVPPLEQFT